MSASPIDTAIGKTVRQARREAEYTQRELAERIGVDHSLISLMESGRRTIAAGTLFEIADACGWKPWVFVWVAAKYLKRPDRRDVDRSKMKP